MRAGLRTTYALQGVTIHIIGQQQAASGAVSVHFGGWCMRTVRFTVLLLALMAQEALRVSLF